MRILVRSPTTFRRSLASRVSDGVGGPLPSSRVSRLEKTPWASESGESESGESECGESAELVGFGFCIGTIVYRRRSPLRLLLETFVQRGVQGLLVAVAVYDGNLGGISRLVVAQGG